MQQWGLREHCKLPQRGLGGGGAPAEIEFGAFYPYNMTFGGSNYTILPFFTCISARPPLRHEAQGRGLGRLPKGR